MLDPERLHCFLQTQTQSYQPHCPGLDFRVYHQKTGGRCPWSLCPLRRQPMLGLVKNTLTQDRECLCQLSLHKPATPTPTANTCFCAKPQSQDCWEPEAKGTFRSIHVITGAESHSTECIWGGTTCRSHKTEIQLVKMASKNIYPLSHFAGLKKKLFFPLNPKFTRFFAFTQITSQISDSLKKKKKQTNKPKKPHKT